MPTEYDVAVIWTKNNTPVTVVNRDPREGEDEFIGRVEEEVDTLCTDSNDVSAYHYSLGVEAEGTLV